MKALLALVLLLGACSAWHAQMLPAPASKKMGKPKGFRAGVARVDITPPPGVGLAGSGPEGRRSTGYRTRLSAKALVLEDATGERIALVVADLPHVSANLHRLAAERVVDRTGIGADRLILSATHTHSGPGHFYAERQYNSNSSRVPGYDPRFTDFLVERIAESVLRAGDTTSMAPALINWGTTTIVGATWNRSFHAFCLNPGAEVPPTRCPPDSTRHQPGESGDSMTRHAVDTALFMIRVDRPGQPSTPLASYSVFALHPTTVPSVNTLLDGDTHIRITDSLTRYVSRWRDSTVHLLANGAEGDAAPVAVRNDCVLPRLGVFDPVPSPRGPGEAVDFLEPPADMSARCLENALAGTDTVVNRVIGPMVALYNNLGSHWQEDVPIRRAFATVWLPGRDSLCGWPVIGSATAAGGEGLETRIRGWRWLLYPFWTLGLEENGKAVDVRDGECHSPKHGLLGAIQAPVIVGEHGFPEVAQISVVRIGSAWLAALPAELTTIAARRVLDSMRRAADAAGEPPTHTALIGLSNGFLQYVTTWEEYQWQAYEGGSNMYGPGMQGFLGRRVAELAAQIGSEGRDSSPPAMVPIITAYPGPPSEIMGSFGPRVVNDTARPVEFRCEAGHLVGRWPDAPPGRIFPLAGPWVALERSEDGKDWRRLGQDGDGRLEVHAEGPTDGGDYRWRLVWRRPTGEGFYRLVRLGPDGKTLWTAESATGSPRRCGDRAADQRRAPAEARQ